MFTETPRKGEKNRIRWIMKRDFLKDLGLEPEVIDKIMAQYGADIEKLKAENSAQAENIKTLNAEIEGKNNQIAGLTSQNKELDELKQKFSQIQEQKKMAEDKFNTDLRELKIKNALEKELTKAKAKNQQVIMPLLADFIKNAELDENNNIKGLDQKIKELADHDETSFLFENPVIISGQTPGTKADNVTNGQEVDYKTMTYEQICDYLSKKTL